MFKFPHLAVGASAITWWVHNYCIVLFSTAYFTLNKLFAIVNNVTNFSFANVRQSNVFASTFHHAFCRINVANFCARFCTSNRCATRVSKKIKNVYFPIGIFNITLISAGWDPGLFSLNRLYAAAVLPEGRDYTFWGSGVSQGHSDAVRRIPGVADCRQYTIPVPEALDRVRNGENPELTTREKHTRYCYVVAEEGADKAAIHHAIVTMPNYFADYDTTVEFITAEEMAKNHSGLPHGGSVIRSGVTGWNGENKQTIEYKLTLDSNPQFTASVLTALARAAVRMHNRGISGCQTIFDAAPADLSLMTKEELLAKLL